MRFAAVFLLAACLMLCAGKARAQAVAPVPAPAPALNIPQVAPDDQAQRARDQAAATLAMLAKLPPDVQQQLLQESYINKKYCQQNDMLKHFYDCDCFSLRMMDERMQIGPGIPAVNVISKTDLSACVSTPDIAGYGLNQCTHALQLGDMPTNKMNAVCECTGRALASSFVHRPIADIRVVDAMMQTARAACSQQIGY